MSDAIDVDAAGVGGGAGDGERIARVRAGDEARAIDTIVSAFVADPVLRWMYPEPRQYLTHFPVFVAAFGGKAFAEGSAWRLGEFGAVALWLPPGVEADGEAIVRVLSGTVAEEKQDDLFAVLDQLDAAHPTYRQWYLPWFGVDAALQGRGLGGELMNHCLAITDEDHLPTYLETTNPRNIPFYRRHGFEVKGVAQAGAFPPLTFMSRAAR